MSAYSYYDKATGVFTGTVIEVSDEGLMPADPAGLGKVSGRFSCTRHCVAPDGSIKDYRPPMPLDTTRLWTWSPQDWRWIGTPTQATLAAAARRRRKDLLSDCDWVVTAAAEDGVAVPAEWKAYRKALRDLPTQSGFPAVINWPVPPA